MRKMHSLIAIAMQLFVLVAPAFSQNVGINTTTPRAPLSFGGGGGQKIILYDDGNPEGHTFGLGIAPGVLRIHSYTFNDDIALGFGSTSNFTERMRVKGNGNIGIGTSNPMFMLDVANRMRIRSGGDLTNSAGLWLNRTDNSATQAFFGVEDNNWAGFYGGSGWSFGMNTNNGDVKILSRLGIGTSTPNAPLGFPPALGKKITLYPGVSGDVGMAVQGNLLQIYSDNPNADIAFGYDQAGNFNERFRFRSNGALSINGSTGNAGQVLQSNGAGGASWGSGTNTLYSNTLELRAAGELFVEDNNTWVFIPGMQYSFSTTGNTKVLVNYSVNASSSGCTGCQATHFYVDLLVNNNSTILRRKEINSNSVDVVSGTCVSTLPPGTHTILLRVQKLIGQPLVIMGSGAYASIMTLQIIPQ